MSSSQRSIARLPLHIFTDLIQHRNDDPYTPSDLRKVICRKLVGLGKRRATNIRASANELNADGNKAKATQTSEGIKTVGQIMRMTSPALLRALDPILTNEECNELIRRICRTCTPKPTTARALLRRYSESKYTNSNAIIAIPSDVALLDQSLRGGFRVGSITEIVGRAGVGKTQLAMQLCVVATRMGYGSVFVDTERKLSLVRLNEIAKERHRMTTAAGGACSSTAANESDFEYNYINNQGRQELEGSWQTSMAAGIRSRQRTFSYQHPVHVMNNVTVHSPSSTEELLSVISKLDEEILYRNESASESSLDTEMGMSNNNASSPKYPVKLIILDSIAAPTRRDFGGGNAPQRVAAIFKIAQILKRVADQMQVAIVVINQIDKLQGGTTGSTSNLYQTTESDFVSVTAALGTSWYHCVSTRVALEHEKDPHRDDEDDGSGMLVTDRGRIRTATIAKSNLVGHSTTLFEVTIAGISQVK